MPRSLFTALRACILAAGLGTLLSQVVFIPWVAADDAGMYPAIASLRWPYTVAAIAVVACVQVALVAIWKLLAKVEHDEVFADAAFAWVDTIIAAAVAATAISTVVGVHLLVVLVAVVGHGAPTVVLGLLVVLVAGSAFSLLMVVMRGLLRGATSMRGELAEVV